ncbi:type VI secretion system protein TssA [Jinshanibacter sp. LJY008]|uniref:Type VI secretion system protein TssA n=1 Tax=Limnobaculum eriocheiris TaxID=2897391 RepID=A0A9X1SR26_9GAMM|nr:type VI secretion system protein TssA [Limnobaculum eriocheiris]MCD1127447.1 type VI secretion system protein TssA [Limnobaculum eriocheiris]
MLTNLLQALFGNRDPQEGVKKRIQQHWQLWLAPIEGDNPVGIDPGYDDDFQLIKEEIAKLSGIDAALIIDISEKLLLKRTKDIRVASYYAWARLRLDGISGLADGLELMAGLVARYDAALYPKRAESKKSSVEWLASRKFIDLLEAQSRFQHQDLERAISALSLMVSYTNQWEAGLQPDLRGLIRLFETRLESPEPAPLPSAPVTPLSGTVSTNGLKVKAEEVRSLRDVLDQTRQISAFLREKPDGYLAAFRLMRSIRWDTVTALPPHDNQYATRLIAPRSELKQHLNRLWLQQSWIELLEQVERAFSEAANHFWLDLQRYACDAMLNAGAPYHGWQEICLTDVALMLDRLKGLERLTYSDGTPFADDDTLSWIASSASIRHLDEGEALAPVPVNVGGNWGEIEQQAMEIAGRDGLESAFNWMNSLPDMVTDRQRYLHRMLLARLAEQHGQRDMAFRLLNGLNRECDHFRLTGWEPDLVFELKSRLLKLVQQKSVLKDADKTALNKDADQLLSELTVLHPARALTF